MIFSHLSKREKAIFYACLAVAFIFSTYHLFDTEELTAYTTTVHHALLDSVKVVMENQKLDFTGIEKRTKGFLNIA